MISVAFAVSFHLNILVIALYVTKPSLYHGHLSYICIGKTLSVESVLLAMKLRAHYNNADLMNLTMVLLNLGFPWLVAPDGLMQ